MRGRLATEIPTDLGAEYQESAIRLLDDAASDARLFTLHVLPGHTVVR